MFRQWPIQRQIILLVTVLVLPLAGLLFYDAYDRMNLRRTEAQQRVDDLTGMIVRHLDLLSAGTASALMAISNMQAVRELDAGACDPMLPALEIHGHLFTNALVVHNNGTLICSAYRDGHVQTSVSTNRWFQDASAATDYHVSHPYRDPLIGRWYIMLSYPLFDDANRRIGFFAFSLDLENLSAEFADLRLSSDVIVKVIDDEGRVVLRSQEPELWIGRDIAGSELLGTEPSEEGIVTAMGLDDVPRRYAVRTLGFANWSVHVGVPTASIRGPVIRQLTQGAIVTVVATFFALLIGLSLSWRILKPVRRLVSIVAEKPESLDVERFSRQSSPEVAEIATEFASALIARKAAESREHMLARVFETAQEAMMITDAERRLVAVNRAFEDDTGFKADEVIGQTPRILRSGRHDRRFYAALNRALQEEGHWSGEIWNRRKNGEVFPCYQTITRTRDEQGNIFYTGIMLDISQQKKIERELEHLAHHDPLTDLPNRYLLIDRLRHAISFTRSHAEMRVAVLHIDLDRFKYFNDTFGHPAGDALLVQVGRRLESCLRETDTVARIGGDEFTLIIDGLESRDALLPMIRNIFDALAPPFRVNQHEVRVTISMGICLHPDNASDPTSMLRYADVALYRAKAEGGNRYAFYEDALTEDAHRRFSLENDLRTALATGQFSLVYEPQYAPDGEIAGCEALIRWRHPEYGAIGPLEFIPILGEIGLINEVTEWVIDEACRQLAQWRKRGIEVPRVAVNLSPSRLEESDFAPVIAEAIARYGLSVSDVELEITEGAWIRDPERVTNLILELQKTGVRIAIDDFGTGFSSLAYLKMFSADVIKIDRSFVTRVNHDAGNQEIVRAVVALGHAMKMEVLAEGVETRGEYEWLQAEGCDLFQGFLFSRPVGAEHFPRPPRPS